MIVIGAGMSGLTCAALLTKLGRRRVLVLERHFRPGGVTHDLRQIRGWAWDIGLQGAGLHAIGSSDADLVEDELDSSGRAPGRRLLDFITDGALDWWPVSEPSDVLVYPGFRFEVPFGEDFYREALQLRFAGEWAAIEQYFFDVRRASDWLSLNMARKTLPGASSCLAAPWGWCSEALALQTTRSYLREHFADPLLRAVLASRWGDQGLTPGESSFAHHALAVRESFQAAHTPVGGARSIARALQAALERGGSRILLGRDVHELIVEGGQVRGVRARRVGAEGGASEEWRAPVVVSAIGAVPTWLGLLPESVELPFRDAVRGSRRGPGLVSLSLRLKESPASIGVRCAQHWLFSSADHDEVRRHSAAALRGSPSFVRVSFPTLEDASATRHTAEITSVIEPEAFAAWRQTCRAAIGDAGARGTIAAGLLAFTERHLPGFTPLIDAQELGAASSVEQLRARPVGAALDLPATSEGDGQPWLDIETPLPGLYLTGQDVGSLGTMGAALGGVLTAAKVHGPRGLPVMMRAFGGVARDPLVPRRGGRGGCPAAQSSAQL